MGHNHRQVWFLHLARFLGYPALTLAAGLKIAQTGVDPSSTIAHLLNSKIGIAGLYIIAIPGFWSVRNVVRNVLTKREANKLGAKMVPEPRRLVTAFHTGYVGETFLEISHQYGLTFNMRILWDDVIVTLDHEFLKYMLSTGFTHFGKGERQQNVLESFLGDGIFNRDGHLWKFHRSMTRPFFARERISDFDLYERYTQKLLARITEHVEQGVAVDIQDLFARLTMDAAGEFLFSSTNINSLESQLPVAGKSEIGPRGTLPPATQYGDFVTAFDEVQVLMPLRGRMGPYVWPVLEMKGDKVAEYRRVVDRWVQPWLDSAFERRTKFLEAGGDEKTPAGDTFLDDLVSSTSDRTLIADELINILLAARDTTSALLTFVTYFLTQHPDVMERLRAEIFEHVGPNVPPNYEQVKNMRYMRAVLNETLRLFPPVPINQRAAVKSTVVPSSEGRLYIPGPDAQIVFVLIHMQRREDLWGSDAQEFDPDRWLDDRVKMFVADPMRFVPFNAGPRICLGQQFALNEASFVLTRLLQRFDKLDLAMDVAPEGSLPPAAWAGSKGRKGFEKIWPKNAITLYSKGGLWVKPRKASLV
ncbi:cytochrome P450 family protein [Ceratobasidium sp. AG-Ba]|nr:cytochrome P450 family protein [Ceratobasidium sp. AG-Ba]